MSTPVIIEVALNGATSPQRNRTVPTSIDEIIEQGYACIERGATIVHNHLVQHNLPLDETVDGYERCFSSWLEIDPNLLPMPTIGSGQGIEGKLGHLDALGTRGLLDIGFIDPGSINLGWAEADGTPQGFPYINTYDEMKWAIEQAHRNSFALHFAIFEPGFLRNVFSYGRLGRLTPGSFVKFYFGGENGYMAHGRGVTFGLPPTVKALDAYLEMMDLEGCRLPWFSAVPGGDLLATPVARATLDRGGHLRVGLEDHFGDRQPSNAELVEEVVALCAEVGRPVATPRQARIVLGLAGKGLTVSSFESLSVARDDRGVVTVMLNNPRRKNAIHAVMFRELREVFRSITERPQDRVVVLTGAGDAFCSGADLSGTADSVERLHALHHMRNIGETVLALAQVQQPVIAKVNGDAVGAGMNLALGCDLIYTSDRARFSEIFAKRGLSIDFGGSWLLPRLIGIHKAKELALLADLIDAHEADRLGLLNRVVPHDDLDAYVDDVAARLASGPPIALGLTKRLLNEAKDVTLAEAVEHEAMAQAVNGGTADMQNAIRAFREKRNPTFEGR